MSDFRLTGITRKELRQLARCCLQRGWEIHHTGKNHLRWVWPPTGEYFYSGMTTSRDSWKLVRDKARKIEARGACHTSEEVNA